MSYLKELVNKVMIRNRRANTGIEWTKRHVETIPIEFTREERDLYDAIEVLETISPEFAHGFSLIHFKAGSLQQQRSRFLYVKKHATKI